MVWAHCVFILRYDANVLHGPDGCVPGWGRQGRSLVAKRDRSCGGRTNRDADQDGVLCCGGAITPALWTARNSSHRAYSVSVLFSTSFLEPSGSELTSYSYPVYSSSMNKNICKCLKHIWPLLKNTTWYHANAWGTDSTQQSSYWELKICCSRNSPHFIEPGNLLPCSQPPANGPYPEPVKFNTHSPTLFLKI